MLFITNNGNMIHANCNLVTTRAAHLSLSLLSVKSYYNFFGGIHVAIVPNNKRYGHFSSKELVNNIPNSTFVISSLPVV